MSFLYQNEPINEALITIARVVPQQVGMLKLSKTQLKVLQSIRPGEQVTASQVAERCELSPSWASSLLKGGVNKGYLTRRGDSRLFGGVEYIYFLS